MNNLKKVELHLHLDGSLRLETLMELSGKSIEEVLKTCRVSERCKDLKSYLECFDLPLECLQTKDNLTRVTRELVEDLKKDNVIYAEIRFAPMLHTRKGLTLNEIVDAVLKGLDQSLVRCNIILCMMRGVNEEDNRKVMELAKEYLDKGVCAIDLAGDEAHYPNELYNNLFAIALDHKIPFTIHAGEAAFKDSIKSAIKMGARRLGHGIHIENDLELIQTIKEKDVLLEVCPTSNVDTKAVTSYEEHPIKFLHDQGVKISVNTDNRCVSNISLNKEYEKIQDIFGFTKEDFIKINVVSLEHSFLKEEEKEKFINLIYS